MNRDGVNRICVRLPGAERSDPWGDGHDVWKVGGKIFACISGHKPGVAVKCRDVETAAMLIEVGIGARAPYFHRSWVLLGWDTPDDEMIHRLKDSHALIRAGLPRRLRDALPSAD
ncbi:MAG: MmcQ/YjbR family DNA-binding protein [Alkalilacustris sp.]